jgi:NAD(P) transhydrogenase
MSTKRYDLVVIGGGPGGQKAAVQGAKAGRRVLLIEREANVGGACVRLGTIPTKTLREVAAALDGLVRRGGQLFQVSVREALQPARMLERVDEVVKVHERFMGEQIRRNGVDRWHGRARFVSPHQVEVQAVDGTRRVAAGDFIVIATGSRPREAPEAPADHEHVFDSDSILSIGYLPDSLAVLGGGVIATEYASIFATLGVRVTLIDKGERPLAFLDAEIVARFLAAFERAGGAFLGGRTVASLAWDGVSAVATRLHDGSEVRTDKVVVALGRVANLEGLDVAAAGLHPTARGLIAVDESCRTEVPHIYAVGDVIGPPALASTSMEQGRRAVRHALGLGLPVPAELVPVGVYTIPEMSSVGLSEAQAVARHGGAVVGRARFDEIARGQIAANPDGLLKLVADGQGKKLLGVQVVGEGASELVHVGLMALLAGWEVDAFIDTIFNFPTLAEAYRVAALDLLRRRPAYL